jgi:quinol monooxygenase YgiN
VAAISNVSSSIGRGVSDAKTQQAELQKYVAALGEADGCAFSNCKVGDDSLDLYEIWSSEGSLAEFNKSASSRAFQHACVDCLGEPVTVVKMETPAEWWA